MADESGDVDEDTVEGSSFTFKGNGVEELTLKLKEETGIEGIIVCTRNPLNGNLYPLRLQLPPNNAIMHVVAVPESSKCEIFKTFLLLNSHYCLFLSFFLIINVASFVFQWERTLQNNVYYEIYRGEY